MEYFEEVELTEAYEPYFCAVEDAISIVIIGTFCCFRNLKQIHEWGSHEKIRELLRAEFGVGHVPCYYRLTRLLKILEPKPVNECFMRWAASLVPEKLDGCTVSLDGKTVCSTAHMKR